jgi:hypothetical protein
MRRCKNALFISREFPYANARPREIEFRNNETGKDSIGTKEITRDGFDMLLALYVYSFYPFVVQIYSVSEFRN